MAMTLEFSNLTVADFPAFLKLYEEAFPENERRLYRDSDHLDEFIRSKGGKFRAFRAKENGRFLGFLSYWMFKGYVYVEHFAVLSDERGRNIGSGMLSHLFSSVGENALIEVEKPDTDEARRRISFYERNGFKIREEIEYAQPPYSPEQSGLEMLIMTHGDVKLNEKKDLRELLTEVYGVDPASI